MHLAQVVFSYHTGCKTAPFQHFRVGFACVFSTPAARRGWFQGGLVEIPRRRAPAAAVAVLVVCALRRAYFRLSLGLQVLCGTKGQKLISALRRETEQKQSHVVCTYHHFVDEAEAAEHVGHIVYSSDLQAKYQYKTG